jgi:acid phosphatase
MASEVVFELWRNQAKPYVRVLFSGKPLETSTPLGRLDMIELNDWNAYIGSVLIEDIVKTCNE